jgi:hypothetical protein
MRPLMLKPIIPRIATWRHGRQIDLLQYIRLPLQELHRQTFTHMPCLIINISHVHTMQDRIRENSQYGNATTKHQDYRAQTQ